MKDVFYTILFVWLVSRLINAFGSGKTKQQTTASDSSSKNYKREGETSVAYVPPKSKPINDNAGEYVDYEEIK